MAERSASGWIVSIFLLLPGIILAIPTNFGGFINPAGMRLEDFTARGAIWQENAELKGDWELWRDESVTDSSILLLHLNMTAIVFGIKANEVTLQRKDDKILQFKVVFGPEDRRGKSFDTLNRTLLRNAKLWADSEDGNQIKKGASFYTFDSDEDARKINVVIKPAS